MFSPVRQVDDRHPLVQAAAISAEPVDLAEGQVRAMMVLQGRQERTKISNKVKHKNKKHLLQLLGVEVSKIRWRSLHD